MGFHIHHIVHHITHAITHPVQTVTHAVQDATNAVGDVVSKVPVIGQPIAHAANQVAQDVVHAGQDTGSVGASVDTAQHVAQEIPKQVQRAYHAVGDAGTDIYHGVEHVGQEIEKGINHIGHMMNQSPDIEQPEPYVSNAATVGTPTGEKAEGDDNGESGSAKKKAKASGKKALTVARSSGGGVNI